LDELIGALDAGCGCPIGSLVGQLAERGELRPDAEPARMATATMASLQGGLLLTQARRDPAQLRVALDGALLMLHSAA
jgi:hypothetical protein